MTDTNRTLFEIKNVSVQFGGLKAASDVSFSVREGEIFGLIGPNGAGKTTIFNMITGSITPDQGDILLEGESLLGKRPDQIARSGVSRTFQNIRLFPKMSVAENVAIGLHCQPSYSRLAALLGLPCVRRAEREVQEKVDLLLKIFGLIEYRNQQAGNLAYGLQRRLEIARALATSPKLLLLDEPAAGMNNDECVELTELLRNIRRDFSTTIVIIEHHIDLMMDLCNRICVLNLGKVLKIDHPKAIQNDEEVIQSYLGSRREIKNDE